MFIQKTKKLHILIVLPAKIPALLYGGTERVIWDLGKCLYDLGHQITYLVSEGSVCPFANVLFYDSQKSLNTQIPEDVDLVHLQFSPNEEIKKPYLVTIHGNIPFGMKLDKQCVFVSKNHAERHGSQVFVYNGLDWSNYPTIDLKSKRNSFHFLANAAWKVKNLKGALELTKEANQKLVVLGGHRFNFRMGWRFTFDTHVRFEGMVNNQKKAKFLNESKGLIFPVLWDEPFGLAVIESLYFGCPVFATPYGALPELVNNNVGVLSNQKSVLIEALKTSDSFDKKACHEYAQEQFSAIKMTKEYLKIYEKVMNGEVLNDHQPTLLNKQEEKYLPFK
ncbi:glycosyl transferase [Pedobacter psychrophilus]|uniref:Glycosyl transferase n=1 Tax=Pedobacter psychrophilus TaxID=1826909 RepID=A0A179DIX5_9SPHI|nr:glycosyltransferase [Pedobacter psychrophilus]OAQ40660.1 glycosyl transferase [Pedobacter psychrophilus]